MNIVFLYLYLLAAIVIGCYFLQRKFIVSYCVFSLLFAFEMILITMKVDFRSKVMAFFGKYVFGIYILQRLPMILFAGRIENQFLFFAASFIVTLLFAIVYNRLSAVIKNCLQVKEK